MILGSLEIPLKLLADEFYKGLDKAEKETTKTSSTLSKKFSTLASGAGKVLAGLAVTGIGAVTGAMIASIGNTNDWAEQLDGLGDVLGTTTTESAGLALMAKRLGGDTEQLTSAMSIMTRGLLDAKGGLGPAGIALQNLGISALDAQGNIKPATQLFQEISDKLGNMPDGLNKSSLMMDIFGKSGAEMGDMLAGAANGGLAQFTAEAGKLGLAMTPEQVQNSINFGKAWEGLQQVFSGLAVSIGTELLPILTPMLNDFKDWAISKLPDLKIALGDLAKNIKEEFVPAITNMGEVVIPKIEAVSGAVWNLIQGFNNLPQPVKDVIVTATEFIAILAVAWPTITSITGALATLGVAGLNPLAGALILLGVVWVNFGQKALETSTMIAYLVFAVLGRNIQTFKDIFVGAINIINRNIQTFINMIYSVRNALANLTIPSWLQMHSPPPLATALSMVSSEMKNLSKQVLPEFSAQMNIQGIISPSAQNIQASNNFDVSPIVDAMNNQEGFDYHRFGIAVRDAMLQVAG